LKLVGAVWRYREDHVIGLDAERLQSPANKGICIGLNFLDRGDDVFHPPTLANARSAESMAPLT
jgi:hypothetical protein